MEARYDGAAGATRMNAYSVVGWQHHRGRGLASEHVSSFIVYVTFDCADPRSLGRFWSAATGYPAVMEEDDFVALAAPDERGVRGILFWKVPEPKATKNRMHVDLASKDPDEEVARLVSLGATMVEHRQGNGRAWTVMQDPEGNEFCIG
jgi:predicted enzyme related to lactoylglutathione lyase